MRISPITRNNFINFSSKVIRTHYGEISDELAQKVDVFEETHKNAKELGHGLFATVYLLDGTKCVIKESLPNEQAKEQNRNFFPEAKALNMIPESVKNTQRLISNVQTEKGNYYLLSTFVEGSTPNPKTKPWTKHSFNGLFETLFQLDKEGIYHNDLNRANCLIGENNKVSAIDYQFAEKFPISNNENNRKEFKTPSFMMPSNAQMFEMAGFPWYIKEMSKTASKEEVRELFKTYLQAKSKYAMQRGIHLQQYYGCETKSEYELLQSKFLANPTDEIIDLQAKKLQILYGFRKTFSIIDKNNNLVKNIGSAISAYIYTIAAAKDMQNYADYLKEKTDDEELKQYLNFEINYAYFWQNLMTEELGINEEKKGIYPWLERNAKLELEHDLRLVSDWDINNGSYEYWADFGIKEGEDIGQLFDVSEYINPHTIEDIAGMIIKDESQEITPEYSAIRKEKINNLTTELKNKLKENDGSAQPHYIDKDVIDYLDKKDKYIRNSKKIIELEEKEKYNALISVALLTEYQKNTAKKAFEKLETRTEVGEKFIDKQKDILNINTYLDMVKTTADMLIYYINSSNEKDSMTNKKFLEFV